MIRFIHGSWAYLVLLMFLITLFVYLYHMVKHKIFDFNTDFRLASFTLIVFYFQVVLGLLAWFTSDYFTGIRQGHMGEYMKQTHDRLIVVEHPSIMLIALLIAHYGFNRMKKAESSQKKYVSIILFYGLALIFILSRIPWQVWF